MENNKEKTTTGIVVQENDNQIVQEETQLVNYDVDAFLEMRKEFITKVNKVMVEGKDYHVIQGKKSLAKGGAEKIASIFGWSASFKKDEDVIGAFKLTDFIPFVCTLSKSGRFVGEGRGGATLQKNNSDPNKTIKMAQKSAFIDAVLRASGLSDFFTQDLEDMNLNDVSKTSPVYTGHNTNTRQDAPARTSAPKKLGSPDHSGFFCSVHDNTIRYNDPGISKKTGLPYKAFYSCTEKDNGSWCKAPILNSEGIRVRQHPETGEMIPDSIDPVTEEDLIFDSTRPNASVEKTNEAIRRLQKGEHLGDYPQ